MFRVNNISSYSELNDYLRVVGDSHCPFISPSISNQLLFFSEYDLSKIEDFNEAIKHVFLYSLVHTELFRKNRFKLTDKDKLLYNENISFSFNANTNKKRKHILSWAHWCLKVLYTKQALLFGKFCTGDQELDKNGNDITEPVKNFISIRPSIKKKDIRFFKKAQHLLDDFIAGEDNGENVLCSFNPEIDLGALHYNSGESIIQVVNQLAKTNLFESIKVEANKYLNTNKGTS